MNQSLTSRLLSFARLIRLSNAFTVITNVIAAQLVFGDNLGGVHLFFVLPVSLAFFFAGMVGNDVADFEHDSRFRPERVLPSGAISLRFANQLYWLLLLFGFAASIVYAITVGTVLPVVLAIALVSLIFLYNLHAKRYWYGCLVMAGCRVANIYMAASFWIGDTNWNLSLSSPHLYPLGMGFFIVGVTHFARNEEQTSRRSDLVVGSIIAVFGLAAIFVSGIKDWNQQNQQTVLMLLLLFVLMLLPMIRAAARAVVQTEPRFVQNTIGVSLRSIIMLDAFVCFLITQNRELAIMIALLLLPTYFLGRWIRST